MEEGEAVSEADQLALKRSDRDQHDDNVNQANSFMLTVSNQPFVESNEPEGASTNQKEDVGLGVPKWDEPFDDSRLENMNWSNSDSNSETEENGADVGGNDFLSGMQQIEGGTGVLQPRAAGVTDPPLQTRGQGATCVTELQPRGQNVEGATYSVGHHDINLPRYTRDQKVEGATGVSREFENLTFQKDLKTWGMSVDESKSIKADEEVEYVSKFQEEFETLDVLGIGGYGIVLKVQKKFDNKTYAVKRIKLRSEEKVKAKREVDALSNCDHPWVVRYFDSWLEDPPAGWQKEQDKKDVTEFLKSKDFSLSESYETTGSDDTSENDSTGNSNTNANQVPGYKFRDDILDNQPTGQDTPASRGHQYLYIQMQFCDGGTLRDFINTGNIKQPKAINLFGQLMCAIEYVHKGNRIHRDIMPKNVFILNGRVKLGDLGLVKMKKDEDKDISYLHTSKQGAEMYRAPELWTKNYNEKVDIYSAGIILFELFYPMATVTEWHTVLTKLKKLEFNFPDDFPHDVKELITMMMGADPDARPAAKEVLQHSLFEEFRGNFFKKRHSLGTGTSDTIKEETSSSDPDSS